MWRHTKLMKNSTRRKIKKFIEENNLLSYNDKIVVGVSGGADSVFLFLVLAEFASEYALSLCAVHVNHGIRGKEALRDEEFTVSFVEKTGYSCYVFHKDIPALARSLKLTEEEAGRKYRYECFENVRKELGYNKIAVAHHKNDQAETVLFQMIRGSGIKGLGGMKPCNGNIIRPLLNISHSEIEEALKAQGEIYCIDATNADNEYARNCIRNNILPYIAKNIQPAVVERLVSTSSQLRDIYEYIEKQAKKLYKDIVTETETACYTEADLLLKTDKVLQREVFMYMIEYMAGKRKDITSKHIEMLIQLLDKETGKRVYLPYTLCAGKDYGKIWIKRAKDITINNNSLATIEIEVPGKVELEYNNGERHIILFKREYKFSDIIKKNNCTKCFDYDKIKFMPQFRHPENGDYMWLRTDGFKKKLSRILIDSKVPVNERSSLWVLAEGSHILWIPAMERCSAYYYVTDVTKEILYANISIEGEKS